MAIVHFYIDSSSNDLINKIVKTPRVTTADILSNIGQFTIIIPPFLNTLNFFQKLFQVLLYWWVSLFHWYILGGAMGLFTGFSILSFFEIIYWLYRLIKANFWINICTCFLKLSPLINVLYFAEFRVNVVFIFNIPAHCSGLLVH